MLFLCASQKWVSGLAFLLRLCVLSVDGEHLPHPQAETAVLLLEALQTRLASAVLFVC